MPLPFRKSQVSQAFAMTLLTLASSLPSSLADAKGQCSSQSGQAVQFKSPPEVASMVGGGALEKGEFETTAEFEARKSSMTKGISGQTLLVEVSSDPDYIDYDADHERFKVSQYAWANIVGNFHAVGALWRLSPTGSISVIDDVYGLGILKEERATGTYDGSNAYGTTVKVTQIERTLYSLFDKMGQPKHPTWKFDYTELNSTDRGGIYVEAKRAVAPQLKTTMRFGIEFAPRDPFLVLGRQHFGPNIDRPTDIMETILVMTGAMKCLVVTDKDGRVLKTFPTPY